MENNKKTIFLTYFLGIIIFQVFNLLYFIVLIKNPDWELFSYNLFGGLILFGLSCIILIILSFLFKEINKIVLLIFLIGLPDLLSLLITGESIYFNILTTMKQNENYLLVGYPISILISFFIVIKYFRSQEN